MPSLSRLPAMPLQAPVVDLRPQRPWRTRLPGRLSTTALWFGGALVLGPAKLMGAAVIGALLWPLALELDRPGRVRPGVGPQRIAAATPPPPGPSRRELAGQLGLPESQLFRARHAAVCRVHHDADGRIVDLMVPVPLPAAVVSTDAHPVS